ncbi:Wadjet anti-phage system protein JetD domain-containing protein [Paeniglutamicibacter sp.]|uniref:Wadjet anti-phage system protein JetD domain-containing protein n=1 Tax=Paeniglutamicibacter sp. TaxID=1934391 RepID=UPI003989C5C9
MKPRHQVLKELERRLANCWQNSVLNAVDEWPHTIALGTPSGDRLETDFAAIQNWGFDWADWAEEHQLELRLAVRKVHGTAQRMPTHIVIPDADTAARLIGAGWPTKMERARQKALIVQGRFPHASLAPLLRELTELNTVDFELLLAVADWFRDHDASGLTPRQVPIEGFDSKWLNTSQHLIQALSGNHDLGLINRPRTVHFAYLDPQHHADGGRRFDSATEGDPSSLDYRPITIIITENKDTALFFPDLERAIAIQGAGAAGPAFIPFLPWVSECDNIIYWGDLDAEGFEIVHQYRKRTLNARTIFMDDSTLDDYGKFGVRHDRTGRFLLRPRKRLELLTKEERATYERITDKDWQGAFRIEQERIPLAIARELILAINRSNGELQG